MISCVSVDSVYLSWNVLGHIMELGRYVRAFGAAALGSCVERCWDVFPGIIPADPFVLYHRSRVGLLRGVQERLGCAGEIGGTRHNFT